MTWVVSSKPVSEGLSLASAPTTPLEGVHSIQTVTYAPMHLGALRIHCQAPETRAAHVRHHSVTWSIDLAAGGAKLPCSTTR